MAKIFKHDGNKAGRTVQLGVNTTLSNEKHNKLLDSLLDRMGAHIAVRETLVDLYRRIDHGLSAQFDESSLDEERRKNYEEGKTTQLPDQKYPLAQGQVEDVVTHVLTILFPARAMYGVTVSDPKNSNVSASFAKVLNIHAEQFGHYVEYGKMVNNALTYNRAGLECAWKVKTGYLGHRVNASGGLGDADIMMQGNKVTSLDVYNTIWDYEVDPTEYSSEAEFYAKVQRLTDHRAMRMLSNGEIFGPAKLAKYLRSVTHVNGRTLIRDSNVTFYGKYQDKFVNQVNGTFKGLYRDRPTTRTSCDHGKPLGAAFDYDAYINGGSQDYQLESPNELLTVTIRIVPKDWGLSGDSKLQIWEFKILNGEWIVSGRPVAQAHGLLPCSCVVPLQDKGATESTSIAEKLIPFQEYISAVYNLYLKGMRKSTNNGLIFYDSDMVSLGQMKDPTSGYVPVKRGNDLAEKKEPMGNFIHTVHERPEINTASRDIAQVHDLMQSVIPTDMLKNLANMDRATTHQSRSVSNAASRRVFRLARDISLQALASISYMMTQNVMSFQQPITVLDENGQSTEIDAKQFQDSGLQIATSDGLRGIDAIAIADRLAQIIQYTLQSRHAQERFDVTKLIEHLMHVEGHEFNIAQFHYEEAWDKLDAQQRQEAFNLLQQAQQQQSSGGQK